MAGGNVLVSACLLGECVRYDGGANKVHHPRLDALIEAGEVISFCPEVAGGLEIPRVPAEIQGGDGASVLEGRARVVTKTGEDVTEPFILGAKAALKAALESGVRVAVLKAGSPSCGNRQIYDGSFSGRKIPGRGVCAALLREHGLVVLNEHELDRLEDDGKIG